MANEFNSLFQSQSEVRSDCRLVERGLKNGWLTPERRSALQKLVWNKCEECADKEQIKEFHALASLLEKQYQFDMKLAEREEERELKRGAPERSRVAVAAPAVVIEDNSNAGGSFESQKQQLLARIRGTGTVGGDSGGS